MKIAIVGAGISGLATAHALLARRPDTELTVYEAAPRTGGKVWTDRTTEGFLCEGGVNGFLDNKPKTLELTATLGLTPVASDAAARRRYIYARGALHRLPESPPAFFGFRAMNLAGRLRVLLESLVPAADVDDESVADFAIRRLGREAFETLIDPMTSGVFAGDARKLSLKSCFPRIHEVEHDYGSLIRGLVRLQLKARREGRADRPGPGPGGTLTSFADGMGELTETLTAALGARLRTQTPVAGLSRSGSRYSVHSALGDDEVDSVILAAPAYAQAAMLRDMAPDIATLLAGIDYPALTVCCMGFATRTLARPADGFGFLVPSREQRRILGTVLDSNVFPRRAPAGYTLMRSMVGGARSPELAQRPDGQIVDLVRAELKDMLGVTAGPEFVRLYRHERAIPQYQVGHAARLEAIDRALVAFPGLRLTGNAFKGVSLNDCVANATALAASLFPD